MRATSWFREVYIVALFLFLLAMSAGWGINIARIIFEEMPKAELMVRIIGVVLVPFGALFGFM